MNTLYKNEQSGRSMVEMLGVLAIIGVLSIGGISGYSKAMSKYRINKTLDQISMLVMNIRSLFASSVDYNGLTPATAISMGIIPADMQGSETTGTGTEEQTSDVIMNAYQGRVFIGNPTTDGKTNTREFYVTYTGLNQESCVALLTADWGAQSGSGLVSVSVAVVPSKSTEPTTGWEEFTIENSAFPISIGTAASTCAGATESSSAAIRWTYY